MLLTRLRQARTLTSTFFGAPRRLFSTSAPLSEVDYDKVAEETLEGLFDYLDTLPERLEPGVFDDGYDVSYAMGVLTAIISPKPGTYVINKQSPNRQIWLSSPLSGPKRYDFVEGRWIYSHDGVSLHALLDGELKGVFRQQAGKIDVVGLERELAAFWAGIGSAGGK